MSHEWTGRKTDAGCSHTGGWISCRTHTANAATVRGRRPRTCQHGALERSRGAHLVLTRRCTPWPTVNLVGASCSIKACRTRKVQDTGISPDLPFQWSSSCRKDHEKGRLSGFPRICPFRGPQAAVKTIRRADRRDFPESALSCGRMKAVLTHRTKKAPSYDGAFVM